MSKIQSNYSENEDDPEVYESSGNDWKEEKEEKKSNKRRSSQRLSKKPRISHANDSTDSEEECTKPKSKNGINKKQKTSTPTRKSNSSTVKIIQSGNAFMTGSFLVAKKDAQTGDPLKHPCIWKIDGKALLQKYEPFEEEGKIRHRNTSIYTGWSALDKDQYAPINVKLIFHSGQKMVVELDWNQLKDINNDSDDD